MFMAEFGYLLNLILAKYSRAYLMEVFHHLSLFMASMVPIIVILGISLNSIEGMSHLLCIFYLFIVIPLSLLIFSKKMHFIKCSND